MKAITEKLSRAKNAKDAKNTMNIDMNPVGSLSPLAGRGQGEGRYARRTTRSSSPSPQPSPLIEGRGSTALRSLRPLREIAVAVSLLFSIPAHADDECGAGPVVECGTTPYANGITYESAVDLSVTKINTGVTTITNNGVNLTGTGNASITWNSTIGGVTGAAGTAGPVIDVLTENGGINIQTGAITGTAASVTHGIRAQSTGAGNIAITTTGAINANNATTGIAAIAAQSAGGNINVVTGTAATTGHQYGIRALTSGTGNVTVTTGTGAVVTHATAGLASIQAVSGTGNITLNLNGRIGANGGGGVSTQTDGLTVINVQAWLGGVSANGLSPNSNFNDKSFFNISGGGAAVINLAGGSSYGALGGGINAVANTGGVTVNNAVGSGGWAFTGNAITLGTGNDTINNAGLVLAAAGPRVDSTAPRVFRQSTADFGGGQDVFNNAGTLVVGTALFGFSRTLTGFDDAFMGRYRLSRGVPVGSEALFQNLEVFNNSGLIVLGAYTYEGLFTNNFLSSDLAIPTFATGLGPRFYPGNAEGEAYCRSVLGRIGLANPPPNGYHCTESPAVPGDTDGLISAVLSMPGTLFTGSGDSAIKLDAIFGAGVAQTNCQQRTGGAETWYRLPGADCVDIRGGETAGSTQIIVRDALPGHQGASNPDGIVIIDVSGGTSAAEHFTLSPESDSYRETVGGRGVIDRGLFVFPLIYDASTQQHKLVGIPGASALQLPLLTHAAQSLSRQTTASGLDERTQQLRAALRSGSAVKGGFWGEFGNDSAERDLIQPLTAAGETFAFNNDYDQDTTTLVLGGEVVIPGGERSAWLLGGSIGYARTELGFTQSGNQSDLEGVVLGVHGGYQTGAWFLNAAFGQAFLQVDDYVSTFNLSTDGSGADTKAVSQSLRIDGGRRFAFGEALYLEPLASLSWVRAEFDDLVIAAADNPVATSNTARFDNAVSLRGGLGARIGFDQALQVVRIHYALTGRYWNEFEGKTGVRIASTGSEVLVSDTFDGNFLDLAGRISVSDAQGHISGYLDARNTSGDGYSSLGFSAGFRYQW